MNDKELAEHVETAMTTSYSAGFAHGVGAVLGLVGVVAFGVFVFVVLS